MSRAACDSNYCHNKTKRVVINIRLDRPPSMSLIINSESIALIETSSDELLQNVKDDVFTHVSFRSYRYHDTTE